MTIKQQTEELIRVGSMSLDIPLDGLISSRMSLFALELEKWNRKINLLARRTTPTEIVDKHILDSLTLLPFLNAQETGGNIVDIGSGAGLPGLVIAIAISDIQVILMEPRAKRVSFLKHIVRSLGLINVEIMETRFSGQKQFSGRQVDFVTSRAVAAPDKFLEMVKPLLERGTAALLMLGPEKRDLWRKTGSVDNVEIVKYLDFVLPASGAKRTVCQIGMGTIK